VAPLTLTEQVVFGYSIPLASYQVLCWRLQPAPGGFVDCDGGTAVGISLTQATGPTPPPATWSTGLGSPGPAGSAVLVAIRTITNLRPAGTDCTQVNFDDPNVAPGGPELSYWTTGNATATKGTKTLSKNGEPFDCSQWTTTDGVGMLTTPVVGYDTMAGGDTANILRLADKP